ncbi:AAA family ATPase [Azospirillum brasilense]|uniref:replication-associated recombination protein A n=1 Tax=Azospirillum brasilense TaxID=192 RepID=UPI00190E366C|nr:replication-associated recombination protein A [Azospirillum brasilense]MBK3732770.1 AAA family ATPase [Azospirillum brasilense]
MTPSSLLASQAPRPLADRLRPSRIAEVAGQEHLLGPDGPIGRMSAARTIASMVLWGPPGCGKTTIARLLARETDLYFEPISALQSGVADLRKIFDAARKRREAGQGTLLFCDEVHHFNKSTQDIFLPHLEDGTVTFIGATTENPSFELNSALLSRVQVFVLKYLGDDALDTLLVRAEAHVGHALPLDESARKALISMADGDGRSLLNMAEQVYAMGGSDHMNPATLGRLLQKRMPSYDKSGDGHYNLLSAFHKSLRASDANAALYWMCRMLDAGEDWRSIARRMLCVANEDIGLADPNAVVQATAAWEAYERLGEAEGERALAQACLYLATAPKSNAVEVALNEARALARRTGSVMPPMHALNAPTILMKELGFHRGYIYDHDTPEGFSGLDYFPESVGRHDFYRPAERGFEREIRKRLQYWGNLRGRKK